MAKKVQKSQIEEIVEQLLEKGRKTGVLTQSEISDALHEQTDLTAEQLGDWGDAMGIETVFIDENTTIRQLKKDLK